MLALAVFVAAVTTSVLNAGNRVLSVATVQILLWLPLSGRYRPGWLTCRRCRRERPSPFGPLLADDLRYPYPYP